MGGRSAIFVAGDENIFFPALVALESMIAHNPGRFDPYICFDRDKLTDVMVQALDYHGIKFVDSKKMEAYKTVSALKEMKEGRWPVEIFLNWALPEYFLELGYEYSIKVDYDILCVKPYDVSEMYPELAIAKGLVIDVDFVKEGVAAEALNKAAEEGRVDLSKSCYLNAGFVAFDNAKCKDFNFFEKLIATYEYLSSACPDAGLTEQIALAFVLSTHKNGAEKIHPSYNHRVRWGVLVDDRLIPTARNLHYITSFKPWVPFDRTKIKHFVNIRQGVLFAYRAVWLEQAAKSPWFSSFCKESPMSQLQTLGLSIVLCHTYNSKISELEAKVKALESLVGQSQAMP
ncbi:MAG TPA: glycosyltransferase [Pseudomonas sp.]|uniref:glycosyltransferase n=1 Tax=Pseudomonas sp. TaxID=306 RepID=UPI002B4A2695|nr:glycosyltransferase [Pseudomonas sp.]HKS14094.1 glycosyltransferase [Pseudomonas sp.]